MAQHPFVGLMAAGVVSLVAHGIAYASLALAPLTPHTPAPSRVSFRVRAPAPPPAPPPPQAPEPPVAERAKPSKPKSAEPVNPTPVTTPPPAVDLRGVTLTNDSGGGSWASAVGDGSALDGPIGPIGARPAAPTAAPSARAIAARPAEPSVVSLADLSTKPVPPELAGNLADRYPAAAKERRIGGSASVEARIEPDGRVRRVTLKSETFAGFAEACRQTLLGSRWSPPRDREGKSVATVVRYTCRFVVQP
jgi:TonB family protein